MNDRHMSRARWRVRVWGATVLTAAALALAGCSSGSGSGSGGSGGSGTTAGSGDAGASTPVSSAKAASSSQAASSSAAGSGSADPLEARLRKEPTIARIEAVLENKPGAYDAYITCAAKVVRKYAYPDKLDDYIAGRIDLDHTGSEASNQKSEPEQEACIKQATG